MKTIKFPHLLFSLAVIAALVITALPAAPAYAMAPDSTHASLTATHSDQAALTSGVSAIVCWNKVVWRDGHRVVIRVCKRVHRHSPE